MSIKIKEPKQIDKGLSGIIITEKEYGEISYPMLNKLPEIQLDKKQLKLIIDEVNNE